MRRIDLQDLPTPLARKSGWPWTEHAPVFPGHAPGGKPWPRVSVVTPSYNQGQYIEETIRSILLQGYPNLEYIVIDGGSTDDSIEIIERYAPWLAHWTSEPDRGQPHAINKGLGKATGEIINWINSDDLLLPGALFEIAVAFEHSDAVGGGVVEFNHDDEKLVPNALLSAQGMIVGSPGVSYHQPGLWLWREGVMACGGVDESLHYTFCWDLAIRYLSRFPRVAHLPRPLVRFRLHQASKTMSQQDRFALDRIAVLEKLSTLEGFVPLHRISRATAERHKMYLGIQNAAVADHKHPLRGLFEYAIRHPGVTRSRFFWGAVRKSFL